MLCPTNLELSTPAVHSASWAVRLFAGQYGEDISESMLFGIGLSSWYGLPTGDPVPFLLTFHPDRLLRMLIALNVPTEVYHCWCTRPPTPDDLAPIRGRRVLLELNRSILRSGESTFGASPSFRRYCVWTTGQEYQPEDGTWPSLELDVPDSKDPITVDGLTLIHAWVHSGDAFGDYRYYVPAIKQLRWNPRVVVRAALGQHLHQMEFGCFNLGWGGMRALKVFSEMLDDHSPTAFDATRMGAPSDGGMWGHRDLMATFLAEATELLGLPQLLETSAIYREIADQWHGLFGKADRPQSSELSSVVKRIMSLEYAALGSLRASMQ
jgi:hypothetical protein